MGIEDILKMPDGPEKAKELAISGLLGQMSEGWHKQWYFERIIETLGYSLDELRRELEKEDGYGGEWGYWEEGIAP